MLILKGIGVGFFMVLLIALLLTLAAIAYVKDGVRWVR